MSNFVKLTVLCSIKQASYSLLEGSAVNYANLHRPYTVARDPDSINADLKGN